MKPRIKTILPILLAIILPGLSLYSSPKLDLLNNLAFFSTWLIASIGLYGFWYALWYLWSIKSKNRTIGLILGLLIFPALLFGLINLVSYQTIGEINGLNFARIFMVSILYLTIQYALKTQEHLARLRLEKEKIQTENYRVQLRAIRAQIDPHFLFNSLNTLRSMVRQGHSKSEEFIMSLSDFYRQTLKHNANTTLPLSEELNVMQSYLFVIKSRNEEAVSVGINIDESVHQFHLPTLALQIIVENCFKHNSMSSKRPLRIEIKNTDGYYIQILNNIQPKIGIQEKSGFGLELLRKRYELMHIQEGIIVEETPEEFSVKLKLV